MLLYQTMGLVVQNLLVVALISTNLIAPDKLCVTFKTITICCAILTSLWVTCPITLTFLCMFSVYVTIYKIQACYKPGQVSFLWSAVLSSGIQTTTFVITTFNILSVYLVTLPNSLAWYNPIMLHFGCYQPLLQCYKQ